MSRKSTIVTLGILGTVAASLGVCCCGGFGAPDDDAVAREKDKEGGGHGVPHASHRSTRWIPFFLPRGTVSRFTGPSGPPSGGHPVGGTSSSSPRGGFGATGHGGGGAHAVGG